MCACRLCTRSVRSFCMSRYCNNESKLQRQNTLSYVLSQQLVSIFFAVSTHIENYQFCKAYRLYFRIVEAVSKSYKRHFKKYAASTGHPVIAGLVLQEGMGENASFETVVLAAGSKWNTSMCTFKQKDEPPYEVHYGWDMCDGHAESVCLRLAFLYFLYEIHCVHKRSPSIFTYNVDTGYQLEEKYLFHLFISHRPCGFMSDKLSQPLFWKDFAGKLPHVLKCSSKILISSYLGIQGPLSCFLSMPIYLSSIVILYNKDSTQTKEDDIPDVKNIQMHFQCLKSKIMHYKENIMKDKYCRDCFLLLENRTVAGPDILKNIDFATMRKQFNARKKSNDPHQNTNTEDDIRVDPYKLLDLLVPEIVVVPTSSLENKKLFNQNPLLIDDTHKNQKGRIFVAFPKISCLLFPCKHGKPCGNKICPCDICGCCTVNCFGCGCPICGCYFDFKSGDRKFNMEMVEKYYFPLLHKPNNASGKLKLFHSSIKVLEKCLSINESITEMEKAIKTRLGTEVKMVFEKLIIQFPSSFYNISTIKFSDEYCDSTKPKVDNFKSKEGYMKLIGESFDDDPTKTEVKDCLQVFEMSSFLLDLRRSSKNKTIVDLDCDWRRHIAMMKYWTE